MQMKTLSAAAITALLTGGQAFAAAPQKPAAAAAQKPAQAATSGDLKTDEEKTLYTLGLVISRNIGTLNLTEQELELVKAGLTDGSLHRTPKVDLDTWGPKVNEMAKARTAQAAAGEKKAGQAFLDKAAAEKGAVKKPSGLVYTETKAGTGASPKPTDTVKVHYKGTLTDGSVFDSSYQRNQPASFQLSGVIPCWTEGVGLMKAGGKAKLVCPSNLAYGDAGSPPKIKPGSVLVFEVELLEVGAK